MARYSFCSQWQKVYEHLVHKSQFIGALLLTIIVSGCDQGYTTLQGQTMGTYYGLSYDPSHCTLNQFDVEARLIAINRSMSTYDPDSEISRINHAAQGEFRISADFAIVMEAAQRIYQQSQGAFDPTIGPLVELWGFGPVDVNETPSAAAQQAAAEEVGMQLVTVAGDRLRKHADGVRLDLSAIAKGYAVDELAAMASSAGCRNYMVDIGGEIKVAGRNPGGARWRVGIEVPDPAQLGQSQAIVELTDMAIATSGDYRNFQVFDNQRIPHVFDPRSGRPVAQVMVSATVLHPQAMLADGYATTLMVLSVEEGLALADAQGLAVYLLYRGDDQASEVETAYNGAMAEYLTTPGA